MSSNAVYEIITDQIIKALESGEAPWRKPWRADISGPRNYEGRPYHGMNTFLLIATGQPTPYWLTRRQIEERGGTIRRTADGKREPYTPVIYWRFVTPKPTADNPEPEPYPMLRFYQVWNLAQTEGIDAPVSKEPVPEFVPHDAAEKIIANYPSAPPIQHLGSQAFYIPARDEIMLPRRESFESADEYYSTAFHELIHSTGHTSRLNRPMDSQAQIHSYGREELVAEMGAAFLCGESGILPATLDNSAAYLRHWVRVIQEDPRAVVWAAGRAQKAADHILGRVREEKA